LVAAVALPSCGYYVSRRAKQSCEDKLRSQVQLGSEEERSAIWEEGVSLMMIAFDAKHKYLTRSTACQFLISSVLRLSTSIALGLPNPSSMCRLGLRFFS